MQQNYINQPVCIEEDEIDLRELFATIWKYKFFIAVFVFIVTALTIVYVLSKPNEYKIFGKFAPVEQSKGMNLGGLGALASMAGVNIGGGSGVTPDVAFQSVLDDYEFMVNFMKKHNIIKTLTDGSLQKDYVFAFDYDKIYKLLHSQNEKNKKIVIYHLEKSFVKGFSIESDKKTGVLTISYTHPSRRFAYNVLNWYLEDATNYLVNKNLDFINSQIAKYKTELSRTNNLELKAELAKLISNLIKQKVYINSTKYYKIKVITDPFIPPKEAKAKPKRGLIVIVAFITSFILAIFLVFFIEFIKNSKEEK